jgi:hypothetical protein
MTLKKSFQTLTVLFMAGHCLQAKPDSTKRSSFWVAGTSYGAIWAHNKPVYHLAQSHTIQVYAEFQQRNPARDWTRNYGNAAFGIALIYLDYRSPVLGKSLAAIAFLEPEISKRLSFRVGSGLVFNSHPFNSESNSTNLMLGSSFACVMHGQINWKVIQTSSNFVRLGLGLTHFSNGAFSQPNSGINNFFISAGYGFGNRFHPNSPETMPSAPVKKGFSWSLSVSGGLVEKFPVGGKKYPVFQIQGRSRYRFGTRSSFLAGFDWMRNEGVASRISDHPEEGNSAGVLGIPLGHELHISRRLFLLSEFGFYVYKKHNLHPGVYQRYGLRHLWWKGAYTALYLKTHRAKAECLEWNLGYQF